MSQNGKLSKFWLWELTRPAFEDWLNNEPAPVVIIGIGSIEQHAEHLPLGCDSIGLAKFIHDVASQTNSVCLHPCWAGYSPHHMEFKGTVTLSWETLLGVLLDTIGSLAYHGVKRFVLINYHGGNDNIMKLAAQIARREYRVMIATPEGPRNTELAKKIEDRMKRYYEVHSCPRETSYALHYFPELVEMWRLEGWQNPVIIPKELQEFMNPDRPDYEIVSQIFSASVGPDTHHITKTGQYSTTDPRRGSAEEGRAMAEEATKFLVDFINTWKKIPIPPGYRDEE
ncbi:creatininase family protein [Candidatus Bathyarchaeota archaeon]|nr:creatininase family protein [Candidatus Bathyarchaeota archaeon]MBS7630606.1 creatininase family protein [Candidatus Bathyarchaeota archaeon]